MEMCLTACANSADIDQLHYPDSLFRISIFPWTVFGPGVVYKMCYVWENAQTIWTMAVCIFHTVPLYMTRLTCRFLSVRNLKKVASHNQSKWFPGLISQVAPANKYVVKLRNLYTYTHSFSRCICFWTKSHVSVGWMSSCSVYLRFGGMEGILIMDYLLWKSLDSVVNVSNGLDMVLHL